MHKRMMTAVLVLLAAVFLCGGVQAAVSETMNVTYHLGDSYTDVQTVAAAPDNGYYMVALHDGSLSLIKTDAKGGELWRYDNLSGNEARSATLLSDGGCLFVTTDSKSSTLYRISSAGTLVYELPLAGIGVGAQPVAVSKDTIKFAGYLTETDVGFTQTFALSNGAPANDQLKLPDGRVPSAIIADGDAYILVGGTSGVAGNSSSAAWIMKMKNGGVVVWDTVIRTDSADAAYGNGSAAFVVCKSSAGGYFVAGSGSPYDLTTVNGLLWGARVTADGAVTWQKDFKGQIPGGVAQIGADYIIAGFGWTAPMYLVVSEGGAISELVYPETPGQFNALTVTSTGDVVMCGWERVGNSPDGFLYGVSAQKSAASSPLPAGIIILGVLGAAALVCRKRKD